MTYDYFISYRRKNCGIERAKEIYDLLVSYGNTVFWDKRSIKEGDWLPQIKAALKETKHFVVLVSDSFFKETKVEDLRTDNYPVKEKPNDWFFEEINTALTNNLTITPVVYDGTFNEIKSGKCKDSFSGAIEKYGEQFYDGIIKNFTDKQKVEPYIKVVNADGILNHFRISKIKYSPNYYNGVTKLVERDNIAKTLHHLFFDNQLTIVNYYSLGGQGKTFFAHYYKEKYTEDYGHIHHFSITGTDLDEGFAKEFREIVTDQDFWKNQVATTCQGQRYAIIRDILKKVELSANKPNLLVIDVNIHATTSSFNKEFLDSFEELKGKWHVLVLSRYPFCNQYKKDNQDDKRVVEFPSLESESDTAFQIYKNIVADAVNSDELQATFKQLHYHPLLITALARKSNTLKLGSRDLLNQLRGMALPEDLQHGDSTQNEIRHYLDNLIDFDDFGDSESKILLRLFIKLPYDFIPARCLEILLQDYNVEFGGRVNWEKYLDILEKDVVLVSKKEYSINGYTVPQYCNFLWRTQQKEEFKGCTEKNKEEYKFKLENAGYRLQEYKSYQLHELLAETLRNKRSTYDYSKYFGRVWKLLSSPDNMDDLKLCFNTLFECIYSDNSNTDIPKEWSILALCHYYYYANAQKETIMKKAIEVIDNFEIQQSCDFEYYNDLANALHDFACVLHNEKKNDEAVMFLDLEWEVRKTFTGGSNREQRLNKERINFAQYTLNCINGGLNTPDTEACKSAFPVDEMKDGNGKLDFMICEHQVTQYQWDCVMGDKIPSCLRVNYHRGLGPNYPMYNITWEEIVEEFLPELNRLTGREYRLPTDSEWDKAAYCGHATTDQLSYIGINDDGTETNEIEEVAWYKDNSSASTHEVKKKRPNGYGLFDLCGNVREYCADTDYWDKESSSPDKTLVVLRGGGWNNNSDFCKISHRAKYRASDKSDSNGFRLCLLIK